MQSRSASAAGAWARVAVAVWVGVGVGLGLGVSGLPVEAGGDDFHKLARLANAATKLKMPRHAQRNAVHPPPPRVAVPSLSPSNKFNDLLVRKSATKAASLKQQQQQGNNNKENNADAAVVVVVVQSSCSCAGSKDLCGIWA